MIFYDQHRSQRLVLVTMFYTFWHCRSGGNREKGGACVIGRENYCDVTANLRYMNTNESVYLVYGHH
jgi:hypothetical protein